MQKLKRKIRSKNQYQMMLFEYIKRREKLRAKYGYKRGSHRHKKYEASYLKAVELLNARIAHIRLQLRRIEKREAMLKQADALVFEFMGVRLWKRNGNFQQGGLSRHHPELVAARGVFIRYCMEECKLESPIISEFLGSKTRGYASVFRKWFIRSFKKNAYYYETWQRFKQYIKREKIAA